MPWPVCDDHDGGEAVDTEDESSAKADLADLLAWARAAGVLAPVESELIEELLIVQGEVLGIVDADRIVGARHGVSVRAIRRRRAAMVQRLRAATPRYLEAVS